MDGDRDALAEIANRIREGDQTAETALIETMGPGLCSYARLKLGCLDIDEVMQTVWEAAIKGLRAGELENPSALKTWVVHIAWNTINDTHRRAATHERLNRQFQLESSSTTAPTADRELDARRLKAQAEKALKQLSHTARQTVYLRLVEERTVAETAERLGLTERQVRVHLYEAKQKMKRLLRHLRRDISS